MTKDTITKDLEALLDAAAAGMKVVCKACGGNMWVPSSDGDNDKPCPSCGSIGLTHPYPTALAWVQAQPDYEAVFTISTSHEPGASGPTFTPAITVFAALALMEALGWEWFKRFSPVEGQGSYGAFLMVNDKAMNSIEAESPHALLRAMLATHAATVGVS